MDGRRGRLGRNKTDQVNVCRAEGQRRKQEQDRIDLKDVLTLRRRGDVYDRDIKTKKESESSMVMAIVAKSFSDLVEDFLLSKKVERLSEHTLEISRLWINRFLGEVSRPDHGLTALQFVADWQAKGLEPSTLRRGVSAISVFLEWCFSNGTISRNPLRDFHIRLPKTLPTVPTDDEVKSLVAACGRDPLGLRNKALILSMADASLRASEALGLLVDHWRERSLTVRGKGEKERTTFLCLPSVRLFKDYLSTRRLRGPEDFLFVNDDGTPMNRRHLIQILHRLSVKAGLPAEHRIYPHALRHYAATSWLRAGMGLDEVRRLLGHASLASTLRYSALVSADLREAHRKAAVIERLHMASRVWLP